MKRVTCLLVFCLLLLWPGYTTGVCDDLAQVYQDGLIDAVYLADALQDAASAMDIEAVNDLSDQLLELGTFLHNTIHAMEDNNCG